MVIDFIPYLESCRTAQASAQAELNAELAAQRAEILNRVNLEWVLADLLAELQAA